MLSSAKWGQWNLEQTCRCIYVNVFNQCIWWQLRNLLIFGVFYSSLWAQISVWVHSRASDFFPTWQIKVSSLVLNFPVEIHPHEGEGGKKKIRPAPLNPRFFKKFLPLVYPSPPLRGLQERKSLPTSLHILHLPLQRVPTNGFCHHDGMEDESWHLPSDRSIESLMMPWILKHF